MDTEEHHHVECTPQSPRCRELIHQTLDLIGNKWAAPIVLTLYAASPLRNHELKKAVAGISAKELAKQLRNLEQAGIIARKVHPTAPPQVEYRLTDLGRTMKPVLEELAQWSIRNGNQVQQHRARGSAMANNEAAPRSYVHRLL